MLNVAPILQVNLFSSFCLFSCFFFYLFFLSLVVSPRRTQTAVYALLSVSSWSIWNPSCGCPIRIAGRQNWKRRVLFFYRLTQSAQPAGTWGKSTRRERKPEWGRNNNGYCSQCIECSHILVQSLSTSFLFIYYFFNVQSVGVFQNKCKPKEKPPSPSLARPLPRFLLVWTETPGISRRLFRSACIIISSIIATAIIISKPH